MFSVKVDTVTAKKIYPPHSKLYKVPRQVSKGIKNFKKTSKTMYYRGKSELIINNLEIFSLYEVFVHSFIFIVYYNCYFHNL